MSKDYDVNLTIMRWGSAEEKATDQIIGQIASLNYDHITLVFDVYAPSEAKPNSKLTIESKTTIFGKTHGGICKYCERCLGT